MEILLLIDFIQAYLIGSISTAILTGRILAGDDIRNHGSGNAGATNALRTYGKGAALLVTLGDCIKAVLAILLGMIIACLGRAEDASLFVYVASFGAVMGHNFPLYFKFRGGKGVLVSIVGILFADWRIGIIVLAAAIAVMAVSRYVSLGSVSGAVLTAVLAVALRREDVWFVVYAVILAALTIFKHRSNIKRLLHGKESKLSFKK